MPKSVAIVGTRGYPSFYGGFETAVRKLAPYLVDRGWETTVYGRGDSPKRVPDDFHPGVRSVNTIGFEKKSLSTLSYGFTSALHVMIKKPEVALVMNVANGFWLPLLKIAGVRTVVNVDGIEWERAKWGRLAKSVFKTGAQMTARYADVLVSDSIEIQRRWSEEFGRASLFIPYGGDEVKELPVEPGLTAGAYILLVARFVPENTVEAFFDSISFMPLDQEVVIVGSSGYGGPLDDKAEKLADTFPNVRWLGHLSDDQRLHSLWQHAGVYFHGHSVGGTNPALVQAMACGTRVVARDTVYNKEVLGDSATYVEPVGESIAAGILLALKDSADVRFSFKSKMIDRVRNTYNWGTVCAAYERALCDQLGRGTE